jgi:hypothetical protein
MNKSAILAINSLDRYTIATGNNQSQLYGVPLLQQFNNTGQSCNNFQITSGGALIYGYIKKIQVAQTQLFYNIPTVSINNGSFTLIAPDIPFAAPITIPTGFYTPQELAAKMQLLITQVNFGPFTSGFTVTYSALAGFTFSTNTPSTFYFLDPTIFVPAFPLAIINSFLRTYRLIGMDINNCGPATVVPIVSPNARTTQISVNTPIFLYTPYVDIISQTLTKYQKVKDTDSSSQKQGDIIARIYLAGTGNPQIVSGDVNIYPLGSRPFTIVQDMNYCKTIRWSKDEAVNSLDFQLKDQYGELIYQGSPTSTDVYYTEFQMTLLCIEEQD